MKLCLKYYWFLFFRTWCMSIISAAAITFSYRLTGQQQNHLLVIIKDIRQCAGDDASVCIALSSTSDGECLSTTSLTQHTTRHLTMQTDLISLITGVYTSTDQSTNQPINQSVNQSTNQPVNQSINQPSNQSVNQSINQSTNQSVNQPIN